MKLRNEEKNIDKKIIDENPVIKAVQNNQDENLEIAFECLSKIYDFFINEKKFKEVELNAWITSLLAFADSERGEPLCDDELKIFGRLLTPKASIKGIRDLIECFHEEDKFYWVIDVLSSCDVKAQGAILLFLSIVLFGKGYFTDKDKLFIAKLVFLKNDNN